jgi:competence ComEA-like helix-hairpin-helix protein
MPPKSPPHTHSRQQLSLSRKDRLAVLLLLTGTLLYWLFSRLANNDKIHWNYAEVPFEQKSPPIKTQYASRPRPKEWIAYQGDYSYKSPKSHPSARSFERDSHYRPNFKQEKYASRRMAKTPLVILMNQADSVDWEQLPGIGPVLAARIVKYRKKLGGFHSTSQLKEVFGITDSVYEKIATTIQSDATNLQKIDINKATMEELKQHPYIRWETAKAIVRYRESHGRFHSLESLNDIWNISPETIAKIEPYLLASTDSLYHQ